MLQEELTERQDKVLKFIQRSVLTSGYPPTLREIGREFGIRSTNGVNDHLKALMRKGYLAKENGKSRTLTLLQPKTRSVSGSRHKFPKKIPIVETIEHWKATSHFERLVAVFNAKAQEITIYQKNVDGAHTILTNFHFAI